MRSSLILIALTALTASCSGGTDGGSTNEANAPGNDEPTGNYVARINEASCQIFTFCHNRYSSMSECFNDLPSALECPTYNTANANECVRGMERYGDSCENTGGYDGDFDYALACELICDAG